MMTKAEREFMQAYCDWEGSYGHLIGQVFSVNAAELRDAAQKLRAQHKRNERSKARRAAQDASSITMRGLLGMAEGFTQSAEKYEAAISAWDELGELYDDASVS